MHWKNKRLEIRFAHSLAALSHFLTIFDLDELLVRNSPNGQFTVVEREVCINNVFFKVKRVFADISRLGCRTNIIRCAWETWDLGGSNDVPTSIPRPLFQFLMGPDGRFSVKIVEISTSI